MPDPRFFGKPAQLTLGRLAEISKCRLSDGADADLPVTGIAALDEAGPGAVTFFSNTRYREDLKKTKASACVVDPKNAPLVPQGTVALLTENPYHAYALIATALYGGGGEGGTYIHPTAIVSEDAILGENVRVGPYTVIEAEATIGSNSRIYAHCYIGQGVTIGKNADFASHVSLMYCTVGDFVQILPGARIGQEGFGFATENGVHIGVPQLGLARIGSHVHIGANVTIDRGSMRDTVIEDGVRIDNLVQIGHNVRVGRGAILVAQVGIAGSAEIGAYAALGGQSGVAGHLRVGERASIAAQSGVVSDIPDRCAYGGSPAVPVRVWHRQHLFLKQCVSNPSTRKERDDE